MTTKPLKYRLNSAPREEELCPACGDVPQDAKQSSCGHRFCDTCITRITNDNDIPTCPVDKIRIVESFFDKFYQREIKQMPCHCWFRDRGCEWEGKIGGVDEHERDCDYADIACPDCYERTTRVNLQLHRASDCAYRLVSCQYCSQYVQLKQMDDHGLQCPEFPLDCPHACSATGILRRSLEDHLLSHCPNAIHACQFKDNGCVFRGTSSEQEEHQRQSIHLHVMLLARCDKQRQDAMACLKEENRKLKQTIEQWESSLTRIEEFMNAFQEAFDTDDPDEGEERTEALASQLQEVILSIRSQSEVTEQLQETVSFLNPDIADSHGKKIMALERGMGSYKNEQISIQNRLMKVENASVYVSFLWAIDNVGQWIARVESGNNHGFESPSFNVGHYGYKMCVRVGLEGDGTYDGTHFSLFLVIMRGRYDALLQWPFSHHVQFRLLDQKGKGDVEASFKPDTKSRSFQRPTSEKNPPYGYPKFCSLKELLDLEHGFVLADTMFVLATVDTRLMASYLVDHW